MPMKQQTLPHSDLINWSIIEEFLKRRVDSINHNDEMSVKAFSTGYSNLTFDIQIGEWRGVLRRPPFGEIPPRAHDMEREFRVLKLINAVFPLAPKPYVICKDTNIMERPFYVMERKSGIVIEEKLPEEFTPSTLTGKKISEAVVNTLAKLHLIEYKKAGLEDLGKPDGYLKRQVEGWIERYRRSQTHDIEGGPDIEAYLLKQRPLQFYRSSIIHNDFKLNNMMFDRNDPSTVMGVFDWELATIGDPLSDLAFSLVNWKKEGEPYTGVPTVTDLKGFINRREFVERYAQQTGFDVSSMDYYLTFAFYKLAAILQQIYFRWKKGEIKDDRFKNLDIGIRNLMDLSRKAIRKEII